MLKSVIDIEMNDGDFQRFAAMFGKYQADLKGSPGVWNEVAASSSHAAAAAAGIGAGVGAAFEALHKITSENSSLTRNTERQATAWNSMAQNAGRFTTRVIEATRSLLRWGELTGLVSGILGGGGLFGIERLATSAGEQRRHALALGATPGEVAGFQTNMARVTDPDEFLSNVNTGISDVTSTQYRAMMTAGAHPEGRTDAADAAFDTIEALKKSIDRLKLDSTFAPTAHAMGYDTLMSQDKLKQLRETPRADVERYVREGRADSKKMELTPAQTSVWQDLETQFTRVARTIKQDFIKRLTELAPALEHLSGSFQHMVEVVLNNPHMQAWIDGFAGAIDRFATYLTGPTIDADINKLMGWIDNVFTGIGKLILEIPEVVAGFQSVIDSIRNFWKDPLGTIKEGGVNGPLTDDNPKPPPGSDAFNRARHPDWYTPEGKPKEDSPAADPWSMHRLYKWWHGPGDDTSGASVQKESYSVPRGIRNNNPLNLTYLPGQGASGSDGRFGRYDTPEDGIAASERQLLLYQDRDRLSTISQIVGKWAPKGENDTASYINQVSKDTGIDKDARVDLHDRRVASSIIEAMIRRETGKFANHDVVQRGVDQGLGNNTASRPSMVPNGGRPPVVAINITNATGGSAVVSASQLAVG